MGDTRNLKRIMRGNLLLICGIGAALGATLLILPNVVSATGVLRVVFFVIGIVTVLGHLPSLFLGLLAFRTREGRADFFLGLLGVIAGVLMMTAPGVVMYVAVAIYLIAEPLAKLLLSSHRSGEASGELLKILFGIVLLILAPGAGEQIGRAVFFLLGGALIFFSVLAAVLGWILIDRAMKRAATPKGEPRVYVDADGDGTVDAVAVDTTGDGVVDTILPVAESENDERPGI